MFKEVPSQFDFPATEKEILAFWDAHGVYEKSLAQRAGCKPFVFFEGPPTANGLPHPGHCLTRAMKDLFPRYKTMTGHYCLRKGGWDTHGLPVEVEVCKELGIHTKEEIEAYGVEKFNRKCLESVFRYTKEWEQITRRLGFWVNLDDAYVTYHQSYVESVWWSLKQLFDAGLLYQGHKIVWWWAQGGTALSAGEVGQGYREVDDPSVYVRFPLVMDERTSKFIADCGLRIAEKEPRASALAADRSELSHDPRISLLVWTTTPWTLPSNMFTAVHRDVEYAIVYDETNDERLIIANDLVEVIRRKVKAQSWTAERTVKGAELVGLRYRPPFPACFYDALRDTTAPLGDAVQTAAAIRDGREVTTSSQYVEQYGARNDHLAWRVVSADFVTLESGTGLVHEAPAFGEVDFELWKQEVARFATMVKVGSGPFAPPLLNNVAPSGTFTDEAPDYCRRRWVKDCDKDLIRDLKEREAYRGSGIPLLLHQEQYRHDYPFCWRAEEDPLIQYPRRSWFIRTTTLKDAMLENNERINWLPDHIKHGRFGKFLESNVDWALSRERYWGTPLPIWACDCCGHTEAIDAYDALLAKPGVQGLDVWEAAKRESPDLSEHLKVHKPYIDAVTYDCPKCATDQSRDRQGAVGVQSGGPSHATVDPSLTVGALSAGRMKRVPDVIDCWYDSGAMPFAQWGWPHKNHEMFASQYPADFISEALDQTRGWFYSLTAIATLLFGPKGVGLASTSNPKPPIPNPQWPYPLPFRTCIVLGLLMGEDGLKMSKSKKNYKEPSYIFDHEGADAMRWLFFSGQAPWTSIRFQESAIAEGQREFLIRLYNCYSFFVIYANIDGWTPLECGMRSAECGTKDRVRGGGSGEHARDARCELDRWILSELDGCCVGVYDAMEAYDNFAAARRLIDFVDALSNWYVRRSRGRFWKAGMDEDKRSAYATLYECLVTTAKLIAPFTPFFAETMYQNLVRSHGADAPISVHLCDYPVTEENRRATAQRIDAALNAEVEAVRQLVSCGRAARAAAKLRTRQPLAAIELHHRQADVIRRHEETIRDELNVKGIEYVDSTKIAEYVHYEVKPDFKKLGPRLGPQAPKIKAALARHPNPDTIVRQLEQDGSYTLEVDGQSVELSAEELLVELHAREGWAAERIPGQGILALDTHLTPELIEEGTARDLVNQVQQARKQMELRYEQRIEIGVAADEAIHRILKRYATYIMGETLADALLNQPIAGGVKHNTEVDGHAIQIYIKPR